MSPSEAHWSAVLGEMAAGVGADGLYPLITSGTAALGPSLTSILGSCFPQV